MIGGRATSGGTKAFAERSTAAPGHFRQTRDGLSLSSIGLGTYLGGEDARTDAGYEEAVLSALDYGVNVFDSAINYRGQKSERAIGRALARAFAQEKTSRQEVFVSTKGAYLPYDADDPRPGRRYVAETFLKTGLAPEEEIAQECHCLAPGYLDDQIERSRANLNLETIDLYYLHNVETQLGAVDAKEFRRRLTAAVELLERAVEGQRISSWGLATWDGLRVPPEHPEHLSISTVRDVARAVAGEQHHFRAIQLPFNLAMGQALVYRSQERGENRIPPLEYAAQERLSAFGSASLLQGRLTGDLPEEVADAFPGARTYAQQALQFSRSAPGMTTALVGVSTTEHAAENFALASVEPAEADSVLGLFR